ncbi:N-acetylneuraminate synthase family protein [Alphaproteobacteria bacterium]|nr:N-acetylneuraminate synthase family protein [Alphaproteobacteria bacterium]
MSFSINGKLISEATDPYIIAEIGINHNGCFEDAMRLVDAAAMAGVDAVKFQTYQTSKLLSKSSEYFSLLSGFELKPEQYSTLAKNAFDKNIDAFSACFDEVSADIWNDLNAPAYKIASGDITHLPLLQKIAKFNKPMIISTGASSYLDITAALEAIQSVNPDIEIALLHCISKYPTQAAEANLRCIKTLSEKFGKTVGFSDHTEGLTVPLAAVACGALIIEKHFTLDKNADGPDHKLSADPVEMAELVKISKLVSSSLGNGKKELVEGGEVQTAIRRSISVSKPVKAGEKIELSNLEITRPASGTPPSELMFFNEKRAVKDLIPGQRISVNDVS